jgi:hypothetical protein
MNMGEYFNLNTGKRHFHFIALKFYSSYSIQEYWQDCGVEENPSTDYSFEDENFIIEKKSLIDDFPYFTGTKDYSVNRNNTHPYRYDLIAIKIKNQNILALGYPFSFLAKKITFLLVNNKNYLTRSTFIKVNLRELIKQKAISFNVSSYRWNFLSLNIRLVNDHNLNSIELKGDCLNDSPYFKTYFKNKIISESLAIRSCQICCTIFDTEDDLIPQTKGNIYFNDYGNFRLYVHGSGINIFVIPFLLDDLYMLNCMQMIPSNPLISPSPFRFVDEIF